MIQLVKHFLLRAQPKLALIVALIAVAWSLVTTISPAGNRGAPDMPFMPFLMTVFYGIVMAGLAMEPAEFDMVLPIRRRTLYLARNMAAVLLIFLVAAPVSGTVLLAAALRGGLREILWPWEIATLTSIALALTLIPLFWLLNRTWKSTAGPTFSIMGAIVGMLLVTVYAFLRKASAREVSILPLAVPALLVAALAWLAGYWLFLRYELAPADSRRAPNSSRIGLIDRLPPLARVMAHTVWLQWWYPAVVGFMAFYCFLFTAKKWPDVWIFFLMYAGCGTCVLQLLSGTGQSLLPLVPRRTVFRSVLGPITAAPLLVGGIEAVAVDSAQMVVLGLAVALLTVGMTWFALPSAKEYGRPFRAWLRRMLSILPCLCFFVCAFAPAVSNFIGRWLAVVWSHVTPWVGGKPALLSCVIALAIALLWWRCERKFRHFEPFGVATGFRSAA